MDSSLLIKRTNTKSKFWNLDRLVLACMFACCLLTGYLPNSLIGAAMILLSACMVFTGNIYMAFPILLFYYLPFGNFMGMSVYRYFSFLFFGCTFIYHHKRIKISVPYLAVMVIYLIYTIYFGVNYNLRMGIFAFFDMICIFLLITVYLNNNVKLKRFFEIYVLAALISFFTGMHSNSGMEIQYKFGNDLVVLSRNVATFEDPNYMGFFFSIAVFSMVTLKLFSKKIRIIFSIVLYLMIFSTVSITAIIGNVVFWAFYLVITKQINIKVIIIAIVLLGIFLSLYFYGLSDVNLPIFGPLAYRINDKIADILVEDTSSLTTGRTDITKEHLDYFFGQSLFKQIFGMNASNPLLVDIEGSSIVAHNEYVDVLLNVGAFGAVLLIGFALWRFIKSFKKYMLTKNSQQLCMVMIKAIWFYYAFTLTVFLDWRFAVVFFL